MGMSNQFQLTQNACFDELIPIGVDELIPMDVSDLFSRPPKSNMLDETRRSQGHLSYSIMGELFGQDYRQQLPYHLIFCSHVLLSWIIPNEIRVQWRHGGISVA
jgi:hypothetical protein